MDLFLILYILILMTLFFFLGAAIGGAARSFKTYFFGFKENEYYCCEAASAREHALVEGSDVGKAALATTAVAAAVDQAQEKDDIVKINQDEARVDEIKEWNESGANKEDQDLDIEAPVHRDEDANIEPQTTNDDVAQPIATDEISHEEGFQEAAVIRDDEAPSQEQEAQAPIEWDYTRDQMNYDDVVFDTEGPSDDLTLISGIDVPFQNQLNELGLHQFEQIATLSEREVAYLRSKFGFTSQLNEQVWIEQAQILAAGGVTAYSQQKLEKETPNDQDDQIEETENTTIEKAALAAAAAAVVNEVTAKDDSAYEQRFDYEHGDEEKAQSEDGDYESRFDYESDESQANDNEEQAEVAAKDDSAYEQRFDYEHGDEEKAQSEDGDYESRFDYESDESQADDDEEQAEEASKDDSAYEQRFDYEHGDEEKTQSEDGDYESRFDYESDESQADDDEEQAEVAAKDDSAYEQRFDYQDDQIEETENTTIEKAALAAAAAAVVNEVAAKDDSAYEQRFDYEHGDEEKAQSENGDYESRFDYESDETQTDDGDQQATEQNERLVSREEGDDGRLLGEEARKERDEEWRERYQNERKILPPGQRGEQPQAAVEEAVIVSPAVDSDDLRQIKFISTGIEKKLNLLGVYKLSQIAQWSQEDVDHISEELEFKGRIEEENWISQASQILAATQKVTNADTLTTSNLTQEDHELDQLTDLSEDEKEVLLSNGIARLSQIASWSISHVNWAANLLQIKDPARITNWIETAKKEQTGHVVVHQDREQSLEAVTVSQTHQADHELDQLTDLTEDEKEVLLSNGIARLSQISSWSISHINWIANLLQIKDSARITNWIETAKKGQTGHVVAHQESKQSLEAVTVSQTYKGDHELDQLTDLTEEEKELLLSNGIARLSQIASWSISDTEKAASLLQIEDPARLASWIEIAQKGQTGEQSAEQNLETVTSGSTQEGTSELDQITDISQEEKQILTQKGVASLSQIANWSGADITWAGLLLGLQEKTRALAWVEQAKQLVAGQAGEPGQAAHSGQEDDLKRIRGIDAETETKLKEMGIMSYAQISQFQQTDMDKVNEALGTSGRVERQYWVVQAKVLVDGGETDFSKLYDSSN